MHHAHSLRASQEPILPNPRKPRKVSTVADLLKPSEVCAELRISLPTLARWTKAGVIPVVRVGNGWRKYRREDVEALLRPSNGP